MADLDGVVRIGTEIDSSGFEKGMKDLQSSAEETAKEISQKADSMAEPFEESAKKIATAFEDEFKGSEASIEDFAKAAANNAKVIEANFEDAKARVAQLTLAFNASAERTGATSDQTKKLAAQLAKAEKEMNSAEKALKEVNGEVDDLGDGMKSAEKDVKSFGNTVEKASLSFSDFLSANLISNGITSLVSGFTNAIQESEEFTKSLTRLETNAKNAGNSFESIQGNFKDFVALTGQADSSAEALSNLLQTGFDDAGITKAVEALSGAVVQFPDTLNIESLADGLQETLATGEATGQFGELLDRLGIGAEAFSDQLANVSSEAERQQLVLETLASAGLNDVYQQYAEANAATLGFNEAQANLSMAMSNFVQGVLPMFSGGFASVSETILGLSETFKEGGLLGFAEEAQTVISDFVTGIQESAPEALDAAGELISNIGQSLQEKAPDIIKAGAELISNLITGFLNSRSEIVQKTPEVLDAFLNTISENLPLILEEGKNLILQLALGIINGIPDMIAQLPQIISSVVSFISQNLPLIAEAGVEIIGGIINGLLAAIPDIIAALPELIAAIVEGIIALNASILEAGKYIVEGIWDGISDKADWLIDKIKGWCGGILDAVKEFFGIESPSKVMRDEVGKMLVEGAIIGVNSEAKKLTNAIVQPVTDAQKKIKNSGLAKNLSATIKQARETAVNEAQGYSQIGETMVSSIQTAIDENKDSALASIQSIINDTVEAMEDGEQKDAAKAAGDDIIKAYQEALENGAENAKDYVSESISAITDEFQAQYDDLLSKQQALEETLGGTYLFEVEDGSVFVEDVQSSIDALKDYQTALEELQQRGASAALLDEVARFDTEEGLAVMQNLLGMTDEDFELLNEKWAEKQELARDVAEAFYKDQMDALETEFNQRLMDELNAVPDEVYDIGRTSIEEWILGMNDKLPSLENKAREMAQRAIQAMKDELGIESPSKEGAYVGEMMNAGVVKGIDDSAKDVENAVQRMGFFEKAKSMIPSIQSAVTSSMASFAPMPAYAGGFGGRTETVQTINRNTVQTVEVVANGSGIFDVVVSEGKRRGKSLVTGKGL